MALHQQVVHVVANRDAGYGERYGCATWDSGLVEARLVGAVADSPSAAVASTARRQRAGGVDAGAVTVEVSGGRWTCRRPRHSRRLTCPAPYASRLH